VSTAAQLTRLANLPVLPAARHSEKYSLTHVEIADMLFSLAIKNAKIAAKTFNDFFCE
jgi:hypothetical protein